MNAVAIVAIVAMFFAFLSLGTSAGQDPRLTTRLQAPAEVILYIDPPPVSGIFFPPLPDRNPQRW